MGEETGKDELKNLKAYLSSQVGVGKRTLDLIRDVWDCLDVLEERLSDSEMFPLLKTLYAADENLPGLLEDFIKGINCNCNYKNKILHYIFVPRTLPLGFK